MPLRPRFVRALGAVLLASAAVVAVPSAALAAAPPGPPPEGSTVTPAHAWVDPTHPNDNGRVWFSVDFHFPFPDTHWVTHASAPRLTDGVTHCNLSRDTDLEIATLACEAIGTAIPAELTTSMAVRSEGGDNFGWTVPVTVCPLTGCSDLFELELANASWEVCPGEDLSSQEPVEYIFNVAWNPGEVRVGSLADAGGDATFVSEQPANGALLAARGSLQNPGTYAVPVTITDEFGGEHTAPLDITVKSAAACGQLAATGAALDGAAGVAAGMLALIGFGAAAMIVASRRATRR